MAGKSLEVGGLGGLVIGSVEDSYSDTDINIHDVQSFGLMADNAYINGDIGGLLGRWHSFANEPNNPISQGILVIHFLLVAYKLAVVILVCCFRMR